MGKGYSGSTHSNILNYSIEGFCRQRKKGGIKNDVVYKIRKDLCINNSIIKSCIIGKLLTPLTAKFHIYFVFLFLLTNHNI